MTEVDPKTTLDSLSSSLTSLEAALGPLLAKPFEELTEDLEPLQKARLQVMSGYVVHDLIWIYLRTTGVDPSTHPVMMELQRLKGYFDKIAHADKGATTRSAPQVDKGAAARFINAAIGSRRAKVDPNYTPSAGPSTAHERGEEGTHTRFDESEVDRLLQDREGDDDEDDVEEVKTSELVESVSVEAASSSAKAKGKGKDSGKNARPRMDPFAGYDNVSIPPKAKKKKIGSAAQGSKSRTTPQPSSGEKRSLAALAEDDAPTPPPGGLGATPSLSSQKAAKLKKKQERERKKPKIA